MQSNHPSPDPLPEPVSDGSDGLTTQTPNFEPGTEPPVTAGTPAKCQDALIEENGPPFFTDGDNTYANQQAIAALFARDQQISFDPQSGTFRGYNANTGLWPQLHEPEVKRLLAKFVKKLADENQAKDFLRKRTNSFLSAVLALLKGFTLVIDLERMRGLIPVGNGMLDLSGPSPVLLPFDPAYGAVRGCSIPYHATAECRRFLAELLKPALADADDLDLVQRYLGALLLGGNSAQRFLILYGHAARGKSTLVTLIEHIIGLESVAHLRTSHLPGRFETHGFLNKLLLTAKDVARDFLSGPGAHLLKALVGDDPMETEMKYGGKFRLRGNFNIIVTSNARLRLALEEDEHAWRRRLLILQVAGSAPDKRIANFADLLLREEAEGILAWMVEGAIKHRAELEQTGDFRLTAAQQARTDDLLQESKSAVVFLEGEVIKKKGADLTVEELTQAYLDFCRAKGWEAFGVRPFENALNDLMQKFHGVRRRQDIVRAGKSARGFKHVTLKHPTGESAQ